MDSLKGEFSAMELPDRGQTETPGPLRIVKRNSRRISSESRGTNKSNGKGVKPSDPNGYLTVMKRKNDGDVLGMSLVDHDTDTYECDYRISKSTRYTWQNEPQTKGLVGSQTLNIKKTRRARPSIDDHGNLDAPCHRYTSTASAPLGEGDLRIEDFTNTSTVKIHGNGAKLALSPDLRSQPSRTSCVLCPDVAVTAEITALEDSQKTVWAAIEVSGRLSNLAKGTEPQTGILTGSFIDYELDRYFEFGCLYDLTVEILPMSGNTIVQVLGEQSFPTTIYAGSSILLLAEIRFNPETTSPPKPSGHVRQKSDELMEDLELQLGNSQVNYMQIRVSYAHSAFPEYMCTETLSGVSSMKSRMDTVTVASLKRHNTVSLWSPRPAPAPNPLFLLIEQHWGPEKAREAMQEILMHRSTPRKPANSQVSLEGSSSSLRVLATEWHTPLSTTPPIVPVRTPVRDQTTPTKSQKRTRLLSHGKFDFEIDETSVSRGRINSRNENRLPEPSPSERRGNKRLSLRGDRTPLSLGSMESRSECWMPEPFEKREAQLSKRRSLGAEGLRGLMPKLADLTADSRDKAAKGIAATVRAKAKKISGSGRWNWANWF